MSKAREPLAVAVVASPRPHGNVTVLVDTALAELERHGVRCEKLVLSDHDLRPCAAHDACATFKTCAIDDDGTAILDRVYAADALILASPVYYEDVSAQMKAFIDRNFFRYEHGATLPARAVGLVAIAAETGVDETLATFRRFVALQGDGSAAVFAVGGYADEAGSAAHDEALVAEVRRMALDMVAVLKGGTDAGRRPASAPPGSP